MDTDKIIEKAIKWLSDPKGRELLKTLVYLMFPLIVLLVLRSVRRGKTAIRESPALKPGIAGSSIKAVVTPETLKETKAKEKQKIDREMRELFGRKETSLSAGRRSQAERADMTRDSSPAEPPSSSEREFLRQELLKMISRRKG
jgi:hypothetical protein